MPLPTKFEREKELYGESSGLVSNSAGDTIEVHYRPPIVPKKVVPIKGAIKVSKPPLNNLCNDTHC